MQASRQAHWRATLRALIERHWRQNHKVGTAQTSLNHHMSKWNWRLLDFKLSYLLCFFLALWLFSCFLSSTKTFFKFLNSFLPQVLPSSSSPSFVPCRFSRRRKVSELSKHDRNVPQAETFAGVPWAPEQLAWQICRLKMNVLGKRDAWLCCLS